MNAGYGDDWSHPPIILPLLRSSIFIENSKNNSSSKGNNGSFYNIEGYKQA